MSQKTIDTKDLAVKLQQLKQLHPYLDEQGNIHYKRSGVVDSTNADYLRKEYEDKHIPHSTPRSSPVKYELALDKKTKVLSLLKQYKNIITILPPLEGKKAKRIAFASKEIPKEEFKPMFRYVLASHWGKKVTYYIKTRMETEFMQVAKEAGIEVSA
jgi:hypothetical protein